MNWKIILVYIFALILSVNVVWRIFILYPEINEEIFWIVLSSILWAYLSTALTLIVKFHDVKLESVITKQEDENIRLRDIAEAYIQLVGAKPENVDTYIEAIRQVRTWNYANEQLEYLKKLEDKLDQLLKQQKPIEVKK